MKLDPQTIVHLIGAGVGLLLLLSIRLFDNSRKIYFRGKPIMSYNAAQFALGALLIAQAFFPALTEWVGALLK